MDRRYLFKFESGKFPDPNLPAANRTSISDLTRADAPRNAQGRVRRYGVDLGLPGKSIRGVGMLSGIEFHAPQQLRLRLAFESFRRIHPAMFGQIMVMRLFRDKNILTQICGNNFMVLKVAPPLVVTEGQVDEFVGAIRDVVELAHNTAGFWAEALGLARRAANL